MIKKIEKQRADRHFSKHGVVRNSASRKRGAVTAEVSTPPVPAKRLRKGYAYEPVPVIETPPPKKTATPPGKSRSSFGRVRANKTRSNDYVYDTSEDLPLSPPAPAAKKGPKKAAPPPKKASPAKKEPEAAPDEDMEEVFPTIGPYQCEICQMITDTKADFVAHIKAKHRDVVDEEVLRSLEADIRKSNKKKAVKSPQKQPPKSPAKKPTPASKKKPAAKPASKKAKPASAKKPAPKFEFCDTDNKPASKAKTPRQMKNEAAKMEANDKSVTEDPLGGLEVAANGIVEALESEITDEPAVVMENAEEDVDQPQAQQDNSDELGTPPPQDQEDKLESDLKKQGGDLFDSLFDNGEHDANNTVENNLPVIVQPIAEAPTLGF